MHCCQQPMGCKGIVNANGTVKLFKTSKAPQNDLFLEKKEICSAAHIIVTYLLLLTPTTNIATEIFETEI